MRAATLLVLALVSGCGGGDDCAPKEVVRVQLFGDSTLHDSIEWTRRFDKDGRSALQVEMDNRFGRGRVTIENRAVGGTNSMQLLAGTDGLNKPWPQSVNADLVIFNHALNDIGRESMTEYQANLRTVGSSGVLVMFQTPNPTTDTQAGPYAAAIADTAHALRAPGADVYGYVSALPDWPSRLIDTTHPNPDLYLEIVRKVQAPAVALLVAKMRCE